MKFSRENYSASLIAEMLPLWKAHHAETADDFYGPLDPELSIYEDCAKAGTLRIYTMRQWTGGEIELVGYQVFIVQKHPHSKNLLQAMQDILYVRPESRRGLAGYKFIKWCCEELRQERVRMVFQHISAHHDFSALLKRMGYEHVDNVYGRRLLEVS